MKFDVNFLEYLVTLRYIIKAYNMTQDLKDYSV